MIRTKLFAAAAAVAATGALALSAGAASAGTVRVAGATTTHVRHHATARPMNTGSCGFSCVEPYFLASGPQWIQVDYRGRTTQNNPINLQFRTVTNSREDWLPANEGTVIPEFCPGTPSHDPEALAVDPIFTPNQCAALVNAGLDYSTAYQLRYEPLGVDTHMCSGANNNGVPLPGWRLRLVPCGQFADTVWIKDTNVANPFGTAPYINGASSNYSDPLVVTEASGAPKYQELLFEQLDVDSHGIVADTQLVGLLPGL